MLGSVSTSHVNQFLTLNTSHWGVRRAFLDHFSVIMSAKDNSKSFSQHFSLVWIIYRKLAWKTPKKYLRTGPYPLGFNRGPSPQAPRLQSLPLQLQLPAKFPHLYWPRIIPINFFGVDQPQASNFLDLKIDHWRVSVKIFASLIHLKSDWK